MRKFVIGAALAACCAPGAAQAATILQYSGRYEYIPHNMPRGILRIAAVLKNALGDGEVRKVSLADFESFTISVLQEKPWPHFNLTELVYSYSKSDIQFFNAELVGRSDELVLIKLPKYAPSQGPQTVFETGYAQAMPNVWGMSDPLKITFEPLFARFINAQGDVYGRSWITDVPEPAAWAMLLAGFGITGVQIRRNRSQSHFRSA